MLNLYSFCQGYNMDLFFVYIVWLSVFIFFWVFGSLVVDLFFSFSVGVIAFKGYSFDNLEFLLVVVFSCLTFFLVFLNFICSFFRGGSDYLGCSVLGPVDIVGHQWYWEFYNYNNLGGYSWNSYMGSVVDCVDLGYVLKSNNIYWFRITSSDVLHSFSLPSAGVKIDAVPGRVHFLYILANCFGRYVGYCSEFCGAGHSYMPICFFVV
uniref:cytochrome c oxidase subunit II n=1 Tax=Paradiplozoon yunnanensis TaxID=2268894 RepID=UPI001FAEDF87|nr:cytochrome c oxidase subunit II [Paradiplozoon yunnanensis]UKP90075.1 cytochrome c oxidase subunit II [Paradiplozoon yunnanensis]